MYDALAELADFIDSLPVGRVLDDALRADLIGRIMRIGQGQPMASTGSRYDELKDRLTGPNGKYPPPAGDDR